MTPLQALQKHREMVAALLLIGGLAWWWTAERMSGMNAAPGSSLGTLGWFTGSWMAMMAAMMLPSFAPTLAAYARSTGRDQTGRLLLFTCGYLLVWVAAGLLAYGMFELGRTVFGSELAWDRGGHWLAGGVLGSAAAYELFPLKQICLTRCRGQLSDRHGIAGQQGSTALAKGIRSGGWCVGCSWALMAALFALGVMSLIWMALIAALVALQKVAPWPLAARLATATVLVALAVGIVAAPHEVPGLVVPGSRAMHSMNAVG